VSNEPTYCHPLRHKWRASFCRCGRLIFACSKCPTVRPHTPEQHERSLALRQSLSAMAVETEVRWCGECGKEAARLARDSSPDPAISYVWRCRSCAFESEFEPKPVEVA
jgi:hypothetical protein